MCPDITLFGAPCDRSSRRPQKLLASTQNLRYIYSYIKLLPTGLCIRDLTGGHGVRNHPDDLLGGHYMRNSQFIGISLSGRGGLSCGGARISVELGKKVCIAIRESKACLQ